MGLRFFEWVNRTRERAYPIGMSAVILALMLAALSSAAAFASNAIFDVARFALQVADREQRDAFLAESPQALCILGMRRYVTAIGWSTVFSFIPRPRLATGSPSLAPSRPCAARSKHALGLSRHAVGVEPS